MAKIFLLDLTKVVSTSGVFNLVANVLDRRRHSFGMQGVACIVSFISNRTQTVSFSGSFTSTSPVSCGVPQRSVLGPVLFLL